jgi:hypothetical protein
MSGRYAHILSYCYMSDDISQHAYLAVDRPYVSRARALLIEFDDAEESYGIS